MNSVIIVRERMTEAIKATEEATERMNEEIYWTRMSLRLMDVQITHDVLPQDTLTVYHQCCVKIMESLHEFGEEANDISEKCKALREKIAIRFV
jgi:hypothetical protein